MSADGGELGRGFIRNVASLQGSINHALDRQKLTGLTDPLEGMPGNVIAALRLIEVEIREILHTHDNSN